MRIGPYSLGEALGGGGMGDVFAATHARWGHALAIKLARSAAGRGQEALRDEIRAVAALDHPHVVRIYDQGVVGEQESAAGRGRLVTGAPWLAMERAVGTLPTPNDWEALRRALAELLDGLAAAHAIGLLHLDVKPSNVLVRSDGSHALADFGIVRLRDALGSDPDGVTWGSPAFMAPERFDGRPERLGPPSDLYAVGCMAFSLAHRGQPFPCSTWERAAEAHRAWPPPPLAPKVPVPAGFAEWVRALMAKRPGDRFQTAADARHALLALGRPVVSPGGEQIFGPPAHTLTATAVGEAVDIRELVVGPGEAPPQNLRAPGPAPLPERWELPRRPRRLESVGIGLLGLLAVPFTGRQGPRDALWAHLLAVREGQGPRLVALAGPPGVGRTRLGEAFASAAGEAGVPVVRGLGDEASTVRAALGIPDQLPTRAREAVALRLGRHVEDPLVAQLAEGRGLDALLVELGKERGVVLWVDDLPGQEALVRRAVRGGSNTLVVVSVDDQSLGDLPVSQIITLEPLDVPAARRLLADWVGLGPELVADVAERCGGDLGLALEMVRDGVRTGRLVQGNTGLERLGDEPLPLPEEAVARWRERLPSVEGRLQEALERAAVLGDPVAREALARALGSEELAGELEQLVLSAGLAVAVEGGWRWPSPALRAAILEGASDRLTAHHLACASAAEGPDAEWAAGMHLLEAGQLDAALRKLFSAASDAIASGHMAAAARRLRKVEAGMRAAGLPESSPFWGHLLRCWGLLGPTHLGYAACRAYNERAADLARTYSEDPYWLGVLENAVGGLAWLCNVQLLPKEARRWLDESERILAQRGVRSSYHSDRVGWWALTVGDADRAKRSFQEAVDVALAQDVRHIRYVADAALGVAKRHAGDPDAVEHLERAGRAMLEAGFLSARADLASALGDAERWRGRHEEALAHYDEALRAAAEGEARADPGFRVGYALLLRDMGHLERAQAELETCQALLRDEGPSWEGLIALHLAGVRALAGRPDAFAGVTEAVAKLEETGFTDPDLCVSARIVAEEAERRGQVQIAAAAGHLAGRMAHTVRTAAGSQPPPAR